MPEAGHAAAAHARQATERWPDAATLASFPVKTMSLRIRDFENRDVPAIRACIASLQDHEREIDPRLRPGETIAADYWAKLVERCREADGHVMVAELDKAVVGFVAVLTRIRFTELDDPPGAYALIADLAVLPDQRGKGIGRELLQTAERRARDAGAVQLRIGVLARNEAARGLYLSAGFEPHIEIFEKRWPE